MAGLVCIMYNSLVFGVHSFSLVLVVGQLVWGVWGGGGLLAVIVLKNRDRYNPDSIPQKNATYDPSQF